jgi:hypothetical protein
LALAFVKRLVVGLGIRVRKATRRGPSSYVHKVILENTEVQVTVPVECRHYAVGFTVCVRKAIRR